VLPSRDVVPGAAPRPANGMGGWFTRRAAIGPSGGAIRGAAGSAWARAERVVTPGAGLRSPRGVEKVVMVESRQVVGAGRPSARWMWLRRM
jgi:hypothetical protein